VAAAEYLKGRKLPVEPADLKLHDCVMLNARNNEADWDLVCGRKKARVRVSGPISSRDFNSVSTFVYRGHGSDYCRQPTVTRHSRAVHSYGCCRSGLPCKSRFRGVLESKIPAFEVEHLPGGPGSLEEPAVAQGIKEATGTFAGTRQLKTGQDGAKARNRRHRVGAAINHLRLAGYLRTRGSWVQILPGAPIPSSGYV